MDAGQLASRHPVLYHMAEDGSWEAIQRLGLLSTSALLDRFEVGGSLRFRIESDRRPEMEAVEHPEHGRALIRDNKPMHKTVLARCLTGRTPREWYETLDRRVFFWVDRKTSPQSPGRIWRYVFWPGRAGRPPALAGTKEPTAPLGSLAPA